MSKRGAKHTNRPAVTPNGKPNLADLMAVRKALDLLETQQFDSAKKLCTDVIARDAKNVYANHALGLIASAELDYETAEDWLTKAVALDPVNAEYLSNLGRAQLRQDKIDAAIKTFEAAIAIDTENAAARIGLADALHEKNDPAASIAYFEDAVRREPNAPGPLNHLGKALIDGGRVQEAVEILLKAMSMKIDYAPAHTTLGIAFTELGMLDEALQCHITARMLDNEDIYGLNKLADVYVKQRDFDKAHEVYQRVIEIAPNDPNSHLKLGSSLFSHQDRYDEAMALFNHALTLNPTHAITYNNIGAIMYDHGLIEEGMENMARALALRPNYHTVRHNYGFAQLLKGNLKEGWANHEVRTQLSERKKVYATSHKLFNVIPKWDGKESLQDKYILLMHEQGYGDAIQFLRFAKDLQNQGARVAVFVVDALKRLFGSMEPPVKLVGFTEFLPKCDFAYLMMSLPHALGVDTVEQIPGYQHYLSALPEDVEKWGQRLAQRIDELHAGKTTRPRLKVGLVWAGNPEHAGDRKRSIPVNALGPLLDMQDVQFVSLQKSDKKIERYQLGNETRIITLVDECEDFADTAGIIANLDLVVSVDTSVLHLAGALGAPAWALLANVPDWRWLEHRSDSPWYPGMRLIRQANNFDWTDVIEEVKKGLEGMLAQRA